MKYLLDTCVISDFVKGEPNTVSKLKSISPHHIAVSSITVMEIQFGLALNPKRAESIGSIIHDMLTAVTILDFCQGDAEKSACVRAILKQKGQPIDWYDILLAGTALNHHLIFVSANTKEFKRVNGLLLENWREVSIH